jgi:hypothetical protein
MLEYLISVGGDVNQRIKGLNSLRNLMWGLRLDLYEVLLLNGADPNCCCDEGNGTILDIVEQERWFDKNIGKKCSLKEDLYCKVIQLLKKHGAVYEV